MMGLEQLCRGLSDEALHGAERMVMWLQTVGEIGGPSAQTIRQALAAETKRRIKGPKKEGTSNESGR